MRISFYGLLFFGCVISSACKGMEHQATQLDSQPYYEMGKDGVKKLKSQSNDPEYRAQAWIRTLVGFGLGIVSDLANTLNDKQFPDGSNSPTDSSNKEL